MNRCKFCNGGCRAVRSHIIPESFYKDIYDEKHRLIRSYLSIDNISLPQKGERDWILCAQCESYFNDNFEKPYRKMMDGRFHGIYYQDTSEEFGINHNLFRLFHMSVLWRMAVANGIMWENVNNIEILEDVRVELTTLDSNACPEFKVWGSIAVNDFYIQERGMITKPCVMNIEKINAKICYSLWGGHEWYYKVSRGKSDLIDKITTFPDGKNKSSRVENRKDGFVPRAS